MLLKKLKQASHIHTSIFIKDFNPQDLYLTSPSYVVYSLSLWFIHRHVTLVVRSKCDQCGLTFAIYLYDSSSVSSK